MSATIAGRNAIGASTTYTCCTHAALLSEQCFPEQSAAHLLSPCGPSPQGHSCGTAAWCFHTAAIAIPVNYSRCHCCCRYLLLLLLLLVPAAPQLLQQPVGQVLTTKLLLLCQLAELASYLKMRASQMMHLPDTMHGCICSDVVVCCCVAEVL